MKNFLNSLFSENGKVSMMRFGTFVTLIIFILFSVTICSMLLCEVYRNNGNLRDMSFWGGLSAFFGTVCLNVFTVLGVKAYQKKFENGNKVMEEVK